MPEVSAAPAAKPLFRQPLFVVILLATFIGSVGASIRDMANAWFAADVSGSPAAVALIQAAATLPIFMLAVPAGVLSDILDRRRLLLAVQLLLILSSGTLVTLARSHALTIEWLVALTFVSGICAALAAPTWQAVIPELVAKADLKDAVALNSVGMNIARAIGPSLGGLLVISFGVAAAYGAELTSYLFVVAALCWWKRPPRVESGLSEHFFGALRAGMRYVRASDELHVVLLRTVVFFVLSCCIWSLLPLVARQLLQGSAGLYGAMLGAMGTGAILGALLLSRLHAHFTPNGLVLAASCLTAAGIAGLATAPPHPIAVALMVLLGFAWIATLSTFNAAAQAVLPNWVRGRGLAIYLMVVNGSVAGASLAWGLLAQSFGLQTTLAVGAASLAIVSLAVHRVKLPSGEADLQAAHLWPTPVLSEPVEDDRGPVVIQIEYRISKEDLPPFIEAIRLVEKERRRDGAYAWGVAEHTADPERVIEWFLVESWAEHLRQHDRVSNADTCLHARAQRFHIGPDAPVVHHFVALDLKRHSIVAKGRAPA